LKSINTSSLPLKSIEKCGVLGVWGSRSFNFGVLNVEYCFRQNNIQSYAQIPWFATTEKGKNQWKFCHPGWWYTVNILLIMVNIWLLYIWLIYVLMNSNTRDDFLLKT